MGGAAPISSLNHDGQISLSHREQLQPPPPSFPELEKQHQDFQKQQMQFLEQQEEMLNMLQQAQPMMKPEEQMELLQQQEQLLLQLQEQQQEEQMIHQQITNSNPSSRRPSLSGAPQLGVQQA